MTLRTSFFNKTVFWKTVKRYWPLWAAYLAILIFALPVELHESFQWRDYVITSTIQRQILNFTQASSPLLAFLVAPLSAMAVFSHLYNDRSCGAYASLPLKREAVFLSVTLAGLVPLLAANIITFGALLWVENIFGNVEIIAAATWLAVTSMEVIAFYGFAVLCAQLTGHVLVVPAVYGLLNFTAVAVQAVLMGLCQLFLFGFLDSGIYLTWLSPLVKLLQSSGYYSVDMMTSFVGNTPAEAYIFTGWGTVVSYCIAGLGCITGSLFLFKKRRMESAGDVVAVKLLKPVFKYCLAGGCALVLGVGLAGMFYREDTGTLFGLSLYAGLIVAFLVCGGIGYFAAEMLNRKTFRAFNGAWKGYIIFALVVILGLSSLEFDFFGFEKRVPKAEKVEHVSVHIGGHSARSYTTDDVDAVTQLHKAIIEKKDLILKTRYGYNTSYISLYYTLENGRQVTRSYPLPLTEETLTLIGNVENFMHSPQRMAEQGFSEKNLTSEWILYCEIYGDGIDLSLSDRTAYEFYVNCLLPDMQEGKLSRFWLDPNSVYAEDQYSCEINIAIEDPDKKNEHNTFENLYVTVTTESTRVLEFLEQQGVTPKLSKTSDEMYYEKYGVYPEGGVTSIGGADEPASIVVS